jgi:hypothetical protein
MLGNDILVANDASQFEITIGEVTRRIGIVGRDQAVLNILWERLTPHQGLQVKAEANAPHASAGSITRTDGKGVIWYDLGEPGWAGTKVTGEGFHVIQLGADMAINLDAETIRVTETFLEGAEKAAAPGNGKNHAA